MNQIDFLPESYRRQRSRRGRTARQAIALAVIAVVLLGTAVALKTHTANLERTAQRLEDTVDTERGSLGVLAMLERERESVQKQVELQRELMPAVSYSRVIAALTRSLPPEVAVRELVLRTVAPPPQQIETDAERETRLAQSARVKANGEKQVAQPHLIGIEFRGVCPSDLAVATLIAELDGDPMFSRVTMRTSRAIERGGIRMREFSLTATVDLDRHFEWIESPMEVADAR